MATISVDAFKKIQAANKPKKVVTDADIWKQVAVSMRKSINSDKRNPLLFVAADKKYYLPVKFGTAMAFVHTNTANSLAEAKQLALAFVDKLEKGDFVDADKKAIKDERAKMVKNLSDARKKAAAARK